MSKLVCIEKTIEITYEVSHYHVNTWDPRRYGAVMSVSKDYVTKRYTIDLRFFRSEMKQILMFPGIYNCDDLKSLNVTLLILMSIDVTGVTEKFWEIQDFTMMSLYFSRLDDIK